MGTLIMERSALLSKSLYRTMVRCSSQAAAAKRKIEKIDQLSKMNSQNPSLHQFFPSTSKTTEFNPDYPPYISPEQLHGNGRKVYMETYGCQMNVSDMEIVRSVIHTNGYAETDDRNNADAVLIMTCAIREGAEEKIRKRIHLYHNIRKKEKRQIAIGLLGCMAERLKEKLFESDGVDLIAGPDSYRDLPRLLTLATSGQTAANVFLSHDETYADVSPVRVSTNSVTAFVSIMRGCDNMCTYCIVPFTRGRERSRPIDSIIQEITKLSDEGVKEVTLLGQNVNSYNDLSQSQNYFLPSKSKVNTVDGFKTVYKPKNSGRSFGYLLEKVAEVNPQLRIRFTSPHPKDFPDEVLHIIKEKRNICNQLHLPAQSGSDRVLEWMGRGYTKDSYLTLVDNIKAVLGNDVCLTSDFIAGFCGEEEKDHEDTLDLIKQVNYDFCYCFPYSMREKTRAHRRLEDTVEEKVKQRRTNELVSAFRDGAETLHQKLIGSKQTVLIQGVSKRSTGAMQGRNDGGTKVIVPQNADCPLQPGDYVQVLITGGSSQVLHAQYLKKTKL